MEAALCRELSEDKPIVLICDGHGSMNLSWEALEKGHDYYISVLLHVPHTTAHLIQGEDVRAKFSLSRSPPYEQAHGA